MADGTTFGVPGVAGPARTGQPGAGAARGESGTPGTAATIPLIAEHDSWITVDPVLGCPADCAYCYLGTYNLRATRPARRATPQMVSAALADYLHGRRALVLDPAADATPICLGNYTDMVIARSNRDSLVQYLEAIIAVLPGWRPLVVVTKGELDAELVAQVDTLRWPVYWFLSQSLATDNGMALEFGPVATMSTTLANAELVATSRHQQAVHFWRPFVPELRPYRADLPRLVGTLRSAGLVCSVVLGLKRGPGVPTGDARLRAALAGSLAAPSDGDEVFDIDGWHDLRLAATEVGYPVYRNTSCALGLLGRRHETLGTWREPVSHRLCLPAICPAEQRGRCSDASTGVTLSGEPGLAERVERFLGLPAGTVTCDLADRQMAIPAVIGEHDYNVLTHGLAATFHIRPRQVRREKAWLGAFGGEFQA
jgi:hypothetical protein